MAKVIESFYSKIAGISHKNPDGTSRQNIIKQCRRKEHLLLIREPDNPHSENGTAIKVCRTTGEQLGYINSHVSSEVAPQIDRGVHFDAIISDLTGQGRETRGCNILIRKHGDQDKASEIQANARKAAIVNFLAVAGVLLVLAIIGTFVAN